MDEETTFVDELGCFYDAWYRPLDRVCPAPVPFPAASSFASEGDFLDAVNEWVKLVDVSLNKAVLPVGVSRLYCRPRFAPAPKTSAQNSALAEDTDEASVSETLPLSPRDKQSASPRSALTSPRASKMGLLSPRAAAQGGAGNAAASVSGAVSSNGERELQDLPNRGAWRATLIPAVPSSDEEALLRWSRLVLRQKDTLPPHPRELIEILGVRNKLFVDASSTESGRSAEGTAVVAGDAAPGSQALASILTLPASGGTARRVESVWTETVVRAEKGWDGQAAPMAKARAELLSQVRSIRFEVGEAMSENAQQPQLTQSVEFLPPKRAPVPLRGSTPILSRIRPSTPPVRRLGSAPSKTQLGSRPRTTTNERIAVVDLFDSDNEESDSADKEEVDDDDEKVRKKKTNKQTKCKNGEGGERKGVEILFN